jgi:hypothetical protein
MFGQILQRNIFGWLYFGIFIGGCQQFTLLFQRQRLLVEDPDLLVLGGQLGGQ